MKIVKSKTYSPAVVPLVDAVKVGECFWYQESGRPECYLHMRVDEFIGDGCFPRYAVYTVNLETGISGWFRGNHTDFRLANVTVVEN